MILASRFSGLVRHLLVLKPFIPEHIIMRDTFDIPVIWAAPDDGYFDVIILSPCEEFLDDIAKKGCKPFLCHHSREQFPEFYSVIMVNGMAELVKKNRLDIVRAP